jgi:hypothetical protein
MTDTSTGWERLKCNFFGQVCRRVIGPYLETHGFTEVGGSLIGGLVYARNKVFLEMSYEPETFPDYSPKVVLGIGRSGSDPNWSSACVPIWFLIPSERPESSYPFWTFGDEEGLVATLTKAKESLLDQYARPLWLDEAELRRIIDRFMQSQG